MALGREAWARLEDLAGSFRRRCRLGFLSRAAVLCLGCALALPQVSGATATQLVKDINTLPNPNAGTVTGIVEVGGMAFFSAEDVDRGQELWRSDGTLAGTVLLKDINPGPAFSSPAFLTNVAGTLFFSASDGTNGFELWRSDGTAAGTVLVKDIWPGSSNSSPQKLTNFNGTLFFTAFDDVFGRELWRSDGTAFGTVGIKDIQPGSGSSSPTLLTNVAGTLFFTAFDDVFGRELWTSDGTAAGTVLVKDINAGSSSSSPQFLTNVAGTLFFKASDGTNGVELWTSDGTAAGTVLLKDINPGSSNSGPGNLTNVAGTLFFSASDGTNGEELWRSDGTAAGTILADDINPGPFSSNPALLTVVGEITFFQATTRQHGQELWILLAEDFGDAPDPLVSTPGSYPTLEANDGAVHLLRPGAPILGTLRDGEEDGQPTVNADGDDLGGALDDEDGVVFTGAVTAGLPANLTVTSSAPGILNAWLDFNQDGDWADAGEQVLIDSPLGAGANALSIQMRGDTVAGPTFTRFRLDTAGGLTFDGVAQDGEVEDYRVTVTCPVDLVLAGRTILVQEGFEASGSIATQNLTVGATGDVSLVALVTALRNGTVIEGELSVYSSLGDCLP